MRVLFLQKPEVLQGQRELVQGALEDLDVTVRFAGSPSEALEQADTEIVIAPTLPWLPQALAGLPRLKWIHFLSAGVDRIWEMDVDWRRYQLSKSSGVHAATISEFVLGAILFMLKGFGTFHQQQHRREWKRFWLDECHGKTLTIVGLGTIGTELARLAGLLGMRVVGTASAPRAVDGVDVVYGPDGLHAALAEGDFVVLLVPLTELTRGMMDAAALRAMKSSACLINVARGGIVDERALVEALESGEIGSAVLDVFEEQPLPDTSPLWGMDNVLITPHVAGTTQHYMPRALEVFARNYRRYVAGAELVTPVLLGKGY